MFRVIFYFNHYNTLGHSTRIFSIVKALKEFYGRRIEITILQGGKKQRFIPLSNFAKVYLLPYSLDKRGLFIEESRKIYEKMVIHKKMEEMLKERLSLMKKIIAKQKPDVFITEYFPFGKEFWSFEIPYILEYLKKKTNCKIVSSCGYLSWSENLYEYVKDFYDLILIHSPAEFCLRYYKYLHPKGVEEISKVFKEFSKKIFFTGFILDTFPKEKYNKKDLKFPFLKKKKKKLILVSRGGGIVNKKIILASLLLAKNNKDLSFVICCGPATSSEELKEYKKFSKDLKNVRLIKFLPHSFFDAHLKECDLSINMAGYNTIVRLLYYKKKSLILPYYTTEQRWRAKEVEKYLCSRVIEKNDFTFSLFEKEVKELLEVKNENIKINKDWFSGIANTIKLLNSLV